MKKLQRRLLLSIALTLVMIMTIVIPASAAGPVKVELGTTSTFAVLAGSAITNNGATTINGDAGGDVGLSPDTAITGFASNVAIANHVIMSGTQYIADGVASQAKTDLTAAYNDAAGRTPATAITADLGGTTLTSGVYKSESSIAVTGTLTLDAQGNPEAVFIFQAGSTLTTAAGSHIELINGARYCRVFWQVGSSATLGTNSVFRGHIFALTSITATTGAMIQGQLLALNGAVTLDSNTITNGICADSATLTVIKQVINNDSGTAVASDFTLHVKTAGTSGVDVFGSPANGSAIGTQYVLIAGNYTISENAATGYTVSYSGADSSGNITLASGEVKTVTVINNDVAAAQPPMPPTYYPPLINVIKTPAPIALTSAGGLVTYTYIVTNPGMVALSSVSVTDDKISQVRYVSGDVNADNQLQPSETWTFTGTATLSVTTMNTATARGSAYGMTATDVAYATVTVAPTEVYPPLINVIKTPDPLALTIGGGPVVYTYKVTNPGMVALSNVSVTDNKLSPVNYVSGDVNSDKLLQPGETWIYIGTTTLTATTTNTATAKGSANGMTATDIAIATVIVAPPVVGTVTGGQLPSTATPWYTILLIGACLIVLAVAGFKVIKSHE